MTNTKRNPNTINRTLAPFATLGLALATLSSCGNFAVKDQQDQMLANMARQQQEAKEKQAA